MKSMRRPFRRCGLPAAVLLLATPAAAAEMRPAWHCLPEQTFMMVRMPQPKAFFDTLREQTKFGATVLGSQRMERMMKAFLDKMHRDGADVAPERLDEGLAKYGLEKSDLEAMFNGDVGFGAVLRPRTDGRPPLQMILVWLDPGDGPAERLLAAMKQGLEEQQGDEHPPRRVDLEMAGRQVVWVTEPEMGFDLAAMAGDADEEDGDADDEGEEEDEDEDEDDEDEDDEDAIDGQIERLRRQIAAAPPVQTGLSHTFMTRVGGRLLFGRTVPANPVDAGDGAAAARDWDAESGTDEAKGVFERFLAAQAEAGESPLAEIVSMPGTRRRCPRA